MASQVGVEVVTGVNKLKDVDKAISIFGGSRANTDGWAYDNTYKLALNVASHNCSVISGGGPGIMEAANRGVKDAQNPYSKSIGLNISIEAEMNDRRFQDISVDFEHFPARKIIFCHHSDAFVVAPGGYGTLDELFEVLTLIQTKKIAECPVVLMGNKFWGGLVNWLQDRVLKSDLITDKHLKMLVVKDDWKETYDYLRKRKVF